MRVAELKKRQRRLLVVGASALQVPAIVSAKQLGLTVGVIDADAGGVGVSLADVYFRGSTHDESAVVEAAREFRADGVMTLATDWPMRGVARACESLGLPGVSYEAALRATDKAAMMRAFSRAGVAHPWFLEVTADADLPDLATRLCYPCIVKPVDSSGSRGVRIIASPQALESEVRASRRHSAQGRVLIEELMSGPEVSVEMLILEGEPHVLAITDKVTSGPPHFVEVGHSEPSELREAHQKAIIDLSTRAARALGLTTGAGHAEVMLTSDGPRMIEFGARMGGDHITASLVPLSTGIDMTELCVRLALGERVTIPEPSESAAAIRFLMPEPGTVRRIAGRDAARKMDGVLDVVVGVDIGDEVGPVASSGDRAGHVVCVGRSAADARERARVAASLIDIQTVPAHVQTVLARGYA